MDAESTLEEPNAEQSTKGAHDLPTGVPFIKNNKAMTTIVDKSRVHTHIVKYCTCPEADTADIQLFNMEPKTTFTFDVLNDFLLDNLECGTSAMNYYSKLRRMTRASFLTWCRTVTGGTTQAKRTTGQTQLLHRELMRVARQWRKLKLLKWNGFGHEEKEVRPGDLALFCLACPQPGINVTLPTGTTKGINANNGSGQETPSWLYTRSLVMDGNFKAKHLHATNPANEVSLMDGRGFMVSDALYKEHLAIAKDAVQQPPRGKFGKCISSQIGGHRHRQMRMCEAWLFCPAHHGRFSEGRKYHKHLQDCIANSLLLKMYDELEITPASDYGMSMAIKTAAMHSQDRQRDHGDLMGAIKSNLTGGPWHGNSSPKRIMSGCLVYSLHEFDSRDCTGKSLCQKYKEAMKGVVDSNMAFERLDESANAGKVKDWEAQERFAHERWCHDPTAMDIYEVQLRKVPTRKQQDLRFLMAQGWWPGEARRRGAATWLAEGLAIEEAQVMLQMDVRKLRHWAADTQYHAAIILSKELGDNDMQIMQPDLLILQEDADEDMDTKLRAFEPEKGMISLPSNMGLEKCAALGIADIADQELTLWQGQANDALHHIRVHLADKAVIFRKTVTVAKSQVLSTRAWAQVHSVDMVTWRRRCTAQEIPTIDKGASQAWFWSLDVEGDSNSRDWLNEFYCVHWLRAKAMRGRWAEKSLLVQHEMDWTCNSLLWKADEWIRLGAISKLAQKHGHVAYSEKQCKIYQCLFGEARNSFNRAMAACPPV
ncbi:hypothetical protein C8R48DRAFT_673972 [Suillus tomentosus]|nr:hypothetical protein C8R48DRAFT_673972 [Suillus tomentosus]